MNLPDVQRPEAIERAASVLEARQVDLSEAERAVREAKVGLDSARVEDRLAYASARDANEADPGPRHFDAAQRALEDAERRLGGERLRVEQAQSTLDAAFAEHREQWASELEAQQERADEASLKALDRLEAAERERAQLRGARRWLRQPSSKSVIAGAVPTRLLRNQNGDAFGLDELLTGVRDAIANSSLSVEHERAVERERHQQQAARADAQRQQWREQGVPGG